MSETLLGVIAESWVTEAHYRHGNVLMYAIKEGDLEGVFIEVLNTNVRIYLPFRDWEKNKRSVAIFDWVWEVGEEVKLLKGKTIEEAKEIIGNSGFCRRIESSYERRDIEDEE